MSEPVGPYGYKACPFCRRRDKLVAQDRFSKEDALDGPIVVIACEACGAEGPATFDFDEARDYWNRRNRGSWSEIGPDRQPCPVNANSIGRISYLGKDENICAKIDELLKEIYDPNSTCPPLELLGKVGEILMKAKKEIEWRRRPGQP